MSEFNVLISGAGIAGTVLAYWLGKHGFHVVVLERSSSSNNYGQVIDVEGPAEQIVTRMGLLEKIKAKSTHEGGARVVDGLDRAIGTIPAGDTSASKTIEILRPNLVDILCDATNAFPNVVFRYNSSITAVQQTGSKVIVDVLTRNKSSTTKEEYDFVVAADGLRSATRNLILPVEDSKSCVRSLNNFCAFFSVPAEPQDSPYFRYHNAPGRRGIGIKPCTDKESSAYLTYSKFDERLHEARESRDVRRQKHIIAEIFGGLGWEADRLVKAMEETDNFYFEEISQVYLKNWSYGRCVLLGDTAYCPSPLTGQGTNLAILGAYILAAKIVNDPHHPEQAFRAYEKDLRPYVNKVQPVPLGGMAPLLLNPETAWGIWILRTIVGWVCWLQIWKFLPSFDATPFDLPNLE